MADYVIQEYQQEDVDEMIVLGAKMHREGRYHFLPYLPEKLRQLDIAIRANNRTQGNGWVAKHEGKIIGMYVAFIIDFFFCDVKAGSDYFLYVDPNHRSKFPMMPVRLVKRAEQWAKQQGAIEFVPGNSVMIDHRVAELYRYMKYEIIGQQFRKDLQ